MSEERIIRRRAAWVVGSDGERHELIENGEVVYAGNRTVFVGRRYTGPVDETFDHGPALIGPGFVDLDALFDLDSTILGFDNHPGWRKGRVWARDYVDRGPRDVYSPDEEAFGHEYAMVQLLLNGITTALPIRSILYRAWAETYEENAHAAATAARLGLRIYLGPSYRTGLSTVDAEGRFGIHWDIGRGMAGLADAIWFVRDFDGAHDGLVRGFLQPDRIEGCTDELLVRTAEAGAELDCPVRLHCCQGQLEVRTVHERWGRSSLAVLHNLGFLNRRTLLPHGVYLGGNDPTPERIEKELGWLAETGASIVHCPLVMARHGEALDSFGKLRERGITIGLGTDTFPPDFWQNMHVGMMTTRLVEQSMRVSAADYYTAAAIGGANALGRSGLGRLMPGALADLTVSDLNGFQLGQVIDPIQTLMLSGSGRDVTTVVIDGRTVVDNRTIAGIDLEAFRDRARQQFARLIASYPERAVGHPPVEEIFRPTFPIRARSEN